MYIITSYEEAEKYLGRKADRNRKIYNGMIRSYFYQFMGPKPSFRSHAGVSVESDGNQAVPEKKNVIAKKKRSSGERAGRRQAETLRNQVKRKNP